MTNRQMIDALVDFWLDHKDRIDTEPAAPCWTLDQFYAQVVGDILGVVHQEEGIDVGF